VEKQDSQMENLLDEYYNTNPDDDSYAVFCERKHDIKFKFKEYVQAEIDVFKQDTDFAKEKKRKECEQKLEECNQLHDVWKEEIEVAISESS
jgi:hypothetical protein